MRRTITLTPEEIAEADQIANARQTENLEKDRPDAYGADKEGGLELHLSGARGEKAVAKMLGLPWNGNLGNLKAADVGGNQVRTTKYSTGCLLLHEEDNDDHSFYLVIDRSPRFEVLGPILAREGKMDEFWEDRTGKGRPAYFVPQHAVAAASASRPK
jgi:hypothetical protein